MKWISWPQALVLLIGVGLILLALVIPFSHFSIYYTHESPLGNATTSYTVTCPPPVDQPSCDEYESRLKAAICEDCNDQASTQMTWFWILFSLLILGTAAAYFYMGRMLALHK